MLLWNPVEAALFAVVLVLCCIGLAVIVRNAKKFKLDIDIEPSILRSFGIDEDVVEPKYVQFIWSGTKKFPENWDDVLLRFIDRGEQFAITLKLLGRKLTIIVDGRNKIIERGESGRLLLTFVDLKRGSDLGGRFGSIQSVGLLSNSTVPESHRVTD